MLAAVGEVDATTVRFDLTQPYAAFPNLLTLGILPADATQGPVAQSAMNTHPVGTGPYLLGEWRPGNRMVLRANGSYFGGAPRIHQVTIVFVPDDEARATQLREGKLDGAPLPPSLAKTFARTAGLTVLSQRSADLHAVSLPAKNAVVGDPAVRIALNLGVNRKSIVDGPLAGTGTALTTPLPAVLPEFAESTATFTYDKARAAVTLEQAGWVPGPDGVRAKSGVAARFPLLYAERDLLSKELATAVAADAKLIGIEITPQPVDRTALTVRASAEAELVGGGDAFDPDLGLYPLLHSGNQQAYADQTVDAALDAGRRQTEPAQRAATYRALQRAYVTNPSLVVLAAADHQYIQRDNWTGYTKITDTSTQDTTWGPWWNLQAWTPK
jgi:peptide/nickel transport system substrate-binding protein